MATIVEPGDRQSIAELEEARGSRVISYVSGDRSPLVAQITDDALRRLYEHLRDLEFPRRKRVVDLLLYGSDGDVSVPWKLVNLIREFCDELDVLVPARATGAATLIALGADRIFMGRMGELSPVDPCLSTSSGPVHLESERRAFLGDVDSFLKGPYVQPDGGDGVPDPGVWNRLVDRIGPLNIGRLSRESGHIRLMIGKLLRAGNRPNGEEWRAMVAEVLAETSYTHGHGIGRAEARRLGLPVEEPKEEVEELIWRLFRSHEEALLLGSPLVPERELGAEEEKTLREIPVSLIESARRSHRLLVDLQLARRRNVPASPKLEISLKLTLPPGVEPQQKTQSDSILHMLVPKIRRSVAALVRQELIRQSPVTGVDMRILGSEWRELPVPL